MAVDIDGFLHLFGGIAGDSSACAFDLRELRHVGVAQHEADVGMRDQAAGGVDHIGASVAGELDLGEHVPDQFQIDLGDAHPGVAPRAGKRQCHVRLGFAAEIDRAVIHLVRHRLGEARSGPPRGCLLHVAMLAEMPGLWAFLGATGVIWLL